MVLMPNAYALGLSSRVLGIHRRSGWALHCGVPRSLRHLLLDTSHTSTMENNQENNRVLPRPYALALLTLWRSQPDANGPGENPPLGWALRYDTSTSTYNLPAHRLLQALIEHPPSPAADQVVARRFMTELLLCGNSAVINLGDAPSTLCDTLVLC
jgi:hypothetical protein